MRPPARLISLLLVLVLLSVVSVVVLATRLGIPTSAAGMAAKSLCSGVFVAGREARHVIDEDIVPASVVMRLASMQVDAGAGIASASLPGTIERQAVYRGSVGCTLLGPGVPPDLDDRADVPPRARARAAAAAVSMKAGDRSAARDESGERAAGRLWPAGDHALDPGSWPASVDRDALQRVVARAFSPSGSSSTSPIRADGAPSSTRAVVLVQQGRVLLARHAQGFSAQTPQLGWSMAKTVLSLLAWARFSERQIPLDTPVVDTMTRVPRPIWIGNWQRDQRAGISIDHLLTMRDGLEHAESYHPWSDVPRMLWSEPDMAAWAGRAASKQPPGTDWRYSSAVSNLLSRTLRDQFASDDDYWRYPARVLFEPLGMTGAVMETDADGTFIGSSYLWATPLDWARLGQLILDDGRWQGRQLVPAGWREFALAQRVGPGGRRLPYGPHVWQTHAPGDIDCPDNAALPHDGLLMLGHWGQVVGVFPSHAAVIVRLGWTTDGPAFDRCGFLIDALRALDQPRQQAPKAAAPTRSRSRPG